MDAPASSSTQADALSRRLITGAALIAGLLLALYLSPATVWSLLMLAIAVIAAWEWGGLMQLRDRLRQLYAGATALAIGLLITAHGQDAWGVYLPAVLFWLLAAPLWLTRRLHLRHPLLLAAIGWLLLIPAPLAMIHLRALGPELLLSVVGVVVVADSAAYFVGRSLGRHKLAPHISPGKTWEGLVGGWVGVSLYGFTLHMLWPQIHGALIQTLAAFWLLFILSVAGDLLESWLKREAGVKDSGRLLPGHGGVLDRIDSLMAVLPAAALYSVWFL